jgi:hypothetical protein
MMRVLIKRKCYRIGERVNISNDIINNLLLFKGWISLVTFIINRKKRLD